MAIGQLRITLPYQTNILNHKVMADMEHLFREQEMREQEMATGRPEMYALLGKVREALKL